MFKSAFLLVATLEPLAATAFWLRRRSARAGGVPIGPGEAVVHVFKAAWGSDARPPTSDESRDLTRSRDDPEMALLRASAVGLFAGWFAFSAAPASSTLWNAAWATMFALPFAAAFYCLLRAQPHLEEGWVRDQRVKYIPLRLSFFPFDYEEDGRPWIRRFWLAMGVAAVVWLGRFALL